MAVKSCCVWLLCLFFVPAAQAGPAEDAKKILTSYRLFLLHTVKGNAADLNKERQSWPALDVKGQWGDIDYQDRERGRWKTLEHFRRVHTLALIWASPGQAPAARARTWTDFETALRHWLLHRYQNPNWWHNEIGIPRLVRDIMVLTGDRLVAEDFDGARALLGQYRIRTGSSGANLVWSQDLALHAAAFDQNSSLMKSSVDAILAEIRITNADGIQPDYSFLQHGARLQMYQYGRALFVESVRLAWQLRKTGYAFPASRLNLLRNFLWEGWQWMARGRNTVPGTIDRSVARPGELESADLRNLLFILQELFPGDHSRLKDFEARLAGKKSLSGYRFFPRADLSVYHQPGFSAFLKTISTRTLPTESINSENLLGKLLSAGDLYFVRDGKEYLDMMPVWDWDKLPGLSAVAGAHAVSRHAFSGGLTAGASGMTAMTLDLLDTAGATRFSARKLWIFHAGEVLTLIAPGPGAHAGPAYTVADQSRLRPATLQVFLSADTPRIEHNGLEYRFAPGTNVLLKQGPVSGSWKRVDGAAPADTIKDQVFLPWMEHQQQAANWYSVRAKGSVGAQFKVLKNTAACQFVQAGDGTLFLAFLSPGAEAQAGTTTISTSQPCLVVLSGSKIYLSDPAQTGKPVDIRIGNRKVKATLPKDGTTIQLHQ